MAMQIFYDTGLFDSFPNADMVLKDFLFGTRRRVDLEESEWCLSMKLFIIIVWKKGNVKYKTLSIPFIFIFEW